jgi:peptide-methionine (R)-S-oxide reductase
VTTKRWLATGLAVAGIAGWLASRAPGPIEAAPRTQAASTQRGIRKIVKTETEWKKQLTPEQYKVLREKGTERAFTGKFWDHHARGVYKCAACGLELFDSATKFDSGTGWPSFWAPIAQANVTVHTDRTIGMVREEVVCTRCGGHLGHVFDDGPQPTGRRYCMNSVSLAFDAAKK